MSKQGEHTEDPSPDQDPDSPDENKDFARMLEQFSSAADLAIPEVGARISGRLVMIGEETSFVDYGGRSEGLVETRHLLDRKGDQDYRIGDEIELFVIKTGDQVLLAPSIELEVSAARDYVIEAQRSGVPVSGKVTGMNPGGLEVQVGGLRGFCPLSQIELGYCADPSVYLGTTLEFAVAEVYRAGKGVTLSRRLLLERAERERIRELIGTLKQGKTITGTVSRIQDFGAFVDLGGIDGLVHVSEISHARIAHPQDALQIGQKVRARILSLDLENDCRPRISLSMRAIEPDPWDDVEELYWVGRRIHGRVTRLADFGAFVELRPGVEGLVHVSELALQQVRHPRDVLEAGQSVDAIVLDLDRERKRISLSIRQFEMTGGTTDDDDPKSPPQEPEVGQLVDGWICRVLKDLIVVDLPVFGPRSRGQVPHEETGEEPGVNLEGRFRVGDRLRLEITELLPERRVRLSLIRPRQREAQTKVDQFQKTARSESGGETAMAEAFRRAMDKDPE